MEKFTTGWTMAGDLEAGDILVTSEEIDGTGTFLRRGMSIHRVRGGRSMITLELNMIGEYGPIVIEFSPHDPVEIFYNLPEPEEELEGGIE